MRCLHFSVLLMWAFALWVGALGSAMAQQARQAGLDYRLTAQAVAPGVWVVQGANDDFTVANGCNIINTGFIATGVGVWVINTGPNKLYGEQLRALVRRTTAEPVVKVVHLNLHPDYFLGNQAFADVPLAATAATTAGMRLEHKAYEDNLYRLCGDWMLGTESRLPTETLTPGTLKVGEREFELREWRGHTDSDLALLDKRSGVAFVGGLVFTQRVPTTPHADVARWLASLQALSQWPGVKQMVPSHGPLLPGLQGVEQTQAYLRWLDTSFTQWANQGWELNQVLRGPVPTEFRQWAAFKTEYVRNVANLYPRYERAVLQSAKKP
jgi:quinoprotein relay system zinc metallohydrolase 1